MQRELVLSADSEWFFDSKMRWFDFSNDTFDLQNEEIHVSQRDIRL